MHLTSFVRKSSWLYCSENLHTLSWHFKDPVSGSLMVKSNMRRLGLLEAYLQDFWLWMPFLQGELRLKIFPTDWQHSNASTDDLIIDAFLLWVFFLKSAFGSVSVALKAYYLKINSRQLIVRIKYLTLTRFERNFTKIMK